MTYTPFKMNGPSLYNSPAKQSNKEVSDAKGVVANRKAWDLEKNKAQETYYTKHGSSSGGTDEEWNAQQALIENIKTKYNTGE